MESNMLFDGLKLEQFVEDNEAFAKYVDKRFEALDKDHNGRLSPQELRPAVAAIGSALGLPAQGSSPDADIIYDQVLNEYFVSGKTDGISKEDFRTVLSDILLGVADGLKRDPVSLVTIDGRLLDNYARSHAFEFDALAIFNETDKSKLSLEKALGKLTVEQGMPPASDPWVMEKIVKPAAESCGFQQLINPERNASQEEFVEVFRNVVLEVASQLEKSPVTVAHSEKIYDGKSIQNFVKNKIELDKALQMIWKSLPKDPRGTLPREYLRVALDMIGPVAGLPPLGGVEQMDRVVSEIFKMVKADEGGVLKQDEFNQLVLEILGSLMLQLEGNPISVSSNAVVKSDQSDQPNFLPQL